MTYVLIRRLIIKKEAEEEGFEPPDLLQSTVFKTAALDRSAISPAQMYVLIYFNPNFSDTSFTFAANFFE